MKALKKQLILLALSLPAILCAQPVLQSELNLPRVGDQLIKQEVATLNPGGVGKNVIWDFSSMTVVNNEHIMDYFSREEDALTGSERGALYSFRLSGDSLFSYGYEDPSTLIKYQQPGLLLVFPVVYASTFESAYQGRGKHYDRLESLVSGAIHTTVDAFGTIILPANDTLKQVLRVHIRKEEQRYYLPITPTFNIDSIWDERTLKAILPLATQDRIITDTYQWYEEGYRYPVFETLESYRIIEEEPVLLEQVSYLYHPADQEFDITEDTANELLREAKDKNRENLTDEAIDIWDNLTYKILPNPVKTNLTVELELPKQAAIQFNVHNTMGVIHISENKGFYPAGFCRFQINVSSLPVGNYVLDIWLDDYLVNEIIMKR